MAEKREFHPSEDTMGIPNEPLEYKPTPVFGDKLEFVVSDGYNVEVERYEDVLKQYGGDSMAEGSTCYVYTINVNSDLKEYEGVISAVPRRFSQFRLLHDHLKQMGLSIPNFEFPEQTVQAYFSDHTRESRKEKFQQLLTAAASHPKIRVSEELRRFVGVKLH